MKEKEKLLCRIYGDITTKTFEKLSKDEKDIIDNIVIRPKLAKDYCECNTHISGECHCYLTIEAFRK